ncbi:MAG: (2Fe-2S) ferredoxin domain-containing protein [Deltaproteobacteria bacterium]|nr:(2Fe-2S) ferredoxin domain-containing protein [Deltaproteobacteria bacterium]
MPRFDHHVFVCTNERAAEDPKGSCAHKGSAALHQHLKVRCHQLGLKGKVRVNAAGCLDACAQGPAVVVYGANDPPEGVWYTLRTIADVDTVIEQHLVGGAPVDALRMRR